MATEAGIRALEAWYIRETTPGVTPTNPDWLRFSDELDSVSFAPNSNNFERRAIGSPDPTGFSLGPEDHELGIMYSMQRWLVDGSGPLDASGDGLLRDANGGYRSTHSVLTRQDFASGGTVAGAGFVTYTYAVGAYQARTRISGNPDSGDPTKVEITYGAKKARSYLINQLAAGGTLTVVSSDAGDTTQDVTIESMDGTVSETLSLNGVTPVVGAQSFDPNDGAAGNGIGFIRLSAECQGDVTITATTGAETISILEGVVTNGGIEGDLGLPEIGTGSYETALALPFQTVLAASLTRGGGALATNVMGISFEVLNNIEANAVISTRGKTQSPGDRNINFNGTVFSDRASHDDIVEHLKANAADMVWTFTGGATARTVTLGDAVLQTPGERAYEKGQATMRRDNGFVAQSIAISTGL